MKPYKFKKIVFDDGLLNPSVDATYIIHLENNGRYNHIYQQLLEYHPTNIVYILFNRGYKKSNKKSFINKTCLDLVDAFLEVFKHSEIYNYNNILILEDDFIFNKKIKEIKHKNNINNNIIDLYNKDFIYYLGTVPFLTFPSELFNNKVIPGGGAHAIVYSRLYRNKILKIDQEKIIDWDHLVISNSIKYLNSYIYYIPLCYQVFPETENSKTTNFFIKFIIKLTNLNKKPEPGFSIFYLLSKLLFWIIIFIIIILIYKLYQNNLVIR